MSLTQIMFNPLLLVIGLLQELMLMGHDYLAPYVGVNGDGDYTVGLDYPGYDLEGVADCKTDDVLFGDQTLWWVLMIMETFVRIWIRICC